MEDVVNQHKSQQDKLELLFWAAARGLYGDVLALVGEGVDPACKDKQGRTPGHFAAAHGHAAILEYLSTKGVDLDAEDSLGRAPLHYAALGDHAEAVKLLCQKGCWVDATDGQDDTPLHLAARGLNPSVDQGLKPLETAHPLATAGKPPPSQLAPEEQPKVQGKGAAGLPAPRREYTAAVRALVDAGAKLDLRNVRGLTPLGEAVAWNNPSAVALLLDRKALATVTAKGYTLLHLAAGLGHTECLERLIVEGRRPHTDVTDCPDGLSPLHAAAQQGHLAAARLLVERGADVNVLDDQGRFPYELVPTTTTTTSQNNGSKDVSGPTASDLTTLKTFLESRVNKTAKKPAAAASNSSAAASKASSAQGGASKGGVQGDEGSSKMAELSPRDAFRALSADEQARKVLSYAKQSDSELRGLAFPPPSALPALQALRRAVGLHTCWEAVAAVRQDSSFQDDASDPYIKQAIEDLKKPGVDPSKYAREPQVQAVFAKLNKLYGIMRTHGQGMKVSVDDLLVKRTGPSSVADTLRQLSMLDSKVKEAMQAAVAAVAGLDAQPPVTEPAAASSGDASAQKRSGNGLRFRKVTGSGSGVDEEDDDAPPSLLNPNQPLEPVAEGQEGPPTIGQQAKSVLGMLGWHVLRALISLCVMLSVMWIMGMLPDQVLDKEAAARQALSDALHKQQLAAVDRPDSGAAGTGEAGLWGLAGEEA